MKRVARALFFIPAAILLWACVGTSKPTRFYLLSAPSATGAGKAVSPETPRVLLRIVKFPAYLDRSQIVVREGVNQITLFDFDHWAEPLLENFQRSFNAGINSAAGGKFLAHTNERAGYNYTLDVELQRFDSSSDGEAKMLGRWTLLDNTGNTLARDNVFNLTERISVHPIEIDDRVTALSTLVASAAALVSKEIESLAVTLR